MKNNKFTFIWPLKCSLFIVILVSAFSCIKEEVSNPDTPPTSLTDPRDGETYKLVQIGNQTWFAENLKYSGNIPNITDNIEWKNLTSQAWCFYENDPNNGEIYGNLYNWSAVNTGDLCPAGWHVPTLAEWTELADYLGENAGGKMKSTGTEYWEFNVSATNESGFSGLPGGGRQLNGGFRHLNQDGYWWSSTEEDDINSYKLHLSFNGGVASRYGWNKTSGYAVRCLKN